MSSSAEKSNPRRVALLHTSQAHVTTFNTLFARYQNEVELEHIVAEDLLLKAQQAGTANADVVELVQRTMRQASRKGAGLVVCTCSTIGGIAERTDSQGQFVAMRIDRAMADRAVSLGPDILIVATVASTLKPTCELIEESARGKGISVKIETLLVEEAWTFFLAGRQDQYINTIAESVRQGLGKASVVVLAQASMAAAADALADIGVEVLSSPQTGVERIIEALEGKR